jgi:multimeric flavodoxin WrbA
VSGEAGAKDGDVPMRQGWQSIGLGPVYFAVVGEGGKPFVKITLINGSPRKNGATNKILKQLEENLRKENAAVQINHIDLIDVRPGFCLGCQRCYKTGKCIITTDSTEEIHNILGQSDGIVFGSPTYACNVSGLFKVFHSRVHMTVEQLLYKKPCVLVTTYENTGGKKAIALMREKIMIAGGYISGSIGVKIPLNENPLDEKTKAKIDHITGRFIKDIERKRKPLFSQFYTYIAVNVFFKPFIMKHKDQYDAVIRSWEEKGLIKNGG